MSITITNSQYFKDGVEQTVSSNKCYAGMYLSSGVWSRFVMMLTCTTTKPLYEVTLTITGISSEDNTDGTKHLGMYVTTTKDNTYLTEKTGGETKIRFSKACVNDGSFTDSGTATKAIGTVTKDIPAGTFYIYIVPYQTTNYHSYSAIRSINDESVAPIVTGKKQGSLSYANGLTFYEGSPYVNGENANMHEVSDYFQLGGGEINKVSQTQTSYNYYTYRTKIKFTLTSTSKITVNLSFDGTPALSRFMAGISQTNIDIIGNICGSSGNNFHETYLAPYIIEQIDQLGSTAGSMATLSFTSVLEAGTYYIYLVPNVTDINYAKGIIADTTIDVETLSMPIYIDNGSGWDAYEVYIDNGTSWDLYSVYIDNGSSWDLCG